ncbi:MAG TPA: ThuA domain-containing protein [Bryobacteraceae bacterium]|nr:ThuA domain-containing protein [Bryobacteraceae bacterium]
MIRKILKWLLLTLAAVVLIAAVYGGIVFHRVYYGRHVYETIPPGLPSQPAHPAILIFSKTNGFRDDDAIRSANRALAAIATSRGWSTFFTENGAVFNAGDLARFDATIWNNTSGDVLTSAQKQAFRRYVENGGGFVGIHGAGGDPRYEWRWYVETLIGAQFEGHTLHPQFQRALIRIAQPNDVTMQGLPAEWSRVDEWYSFANTPAAQGAKVLAVLDESTYEPKMWWKDIRMGSHPIIWKHCVGKGRAFYSALGHSAVTYDEPLHRRELANAIAWAAGLTGDNCAP